MNQWTQNSGNHCFPIKTLFNISVYFKKKIRAHRCGWKPSSRSHWSNKKGCTWKHWWNPCGIRDPPKILRKNAVSPFGAWLAVFFFFRRCHGWIVPCSCFVSKMQLPLSTGENGSSLGGFLQAGFFQYSLAAFQKAKRIEHHVLKAKKEECTTIWCAHKLKALFSSTKFS